jgi:gas vesicle protein
MMSKQKSNLLLYGIIIGGIVGISLAAFFGSKALLSNNKRKKERKHKFFEGIDDIFDASGKDVADSNIQSDAEKEIADELFSRSN